MKNITGQEIYRSDGISVRRHADGYIISDGTRVKVTGELPLLSPESLRSQLIGAPALPRPVAVVRDRKPVALRQLLDSIVSKTDEAIELMALGY